MKLLKSIKHGTTYIKVPYEYIEFVFWMLSFNYKPTTIAGTIKELVSNRKPSNPRARNAYRTYERYLVFKNDIGWKLDKEKVKEILKRIDELNKLYIDKYGVMAIKITEEEKAMLIL